jgi:hypothetical protein
MPRCQTQSPSATTGLQEIELIQEDDDSPGGENQEPLTKRRRLISTTSTASKKQSVTLVNPSSDLDAAFHHGSEVEVVNANVYKPLRPRCAAADIDCFCSWVNCCQSY